MDDFPPKCKIVENDEEDKMLASIWENTLKIINLDKRIAHRIISKILANGNRRKIIPKKFYKKFDGW